MADYLTTDTELTSIADAIRTKGGTSASLTYPSGFVQAINDISTGGQGATETVISPIRTPMGTYEFSFEGTGLTGSDFARDSHTMMWFEATSNFTLNVWEDHNDDDDFNINIPAGTIFECSYCSGSNGIFVFSCGMNAAYGFFMANYSSTYNTVSYEADGNNPQYGCAAITTGYGVRNGCPNVAAIDSLELHILKF